MWTWCIFSSPAHNNQTLPIDKSCIVDSKGLSASMDTVKGTLSLLGPDGSRISVAIENYDPRTGQGIIVRIPGTGEIKPIIAHTSVPRGQRESRSSGKLKSSKASAAASPSASPPVLFPTAADASQALTLAGPGFTAAVEVCQHSCDQVTVAMFHNACVSEAWSCLKAPRANAAFEMITPKALPPSGYSSDSEMVLLIEAHFRSSLAAARARSQAWSKAQAVMAEERKRLTSDAAAFFKLGVNASKATTVTDKLSAPHQMSRTFRRSRRKRGREGDMGEASTADLPSEGDEVTESPPHTSQQPDANAGSHDSTFVPGVNPMLEGVLSSSFPAAAGAAPGAASTGREGAASEQAPLLANTPAALNASNSQPCNAAQGQNEGSN
jgi:hypothetical protein